MKDKEIRRMILEELTTGLPSDLVIMEKITESKLAERISNLLKEERKKYIKIGYSNALNDRVKNIKKNLTTK